MVEGARKRDEKTWWRTAWSVSHLLNIAGKTLKKGNESSPAKLLGKVIGGASK